MATLHAKSQCCHAPVHRFGGRRRRCSRCGRTWSVRHRRRGPSAERPATWLAELALRERAPTKLLARRFRRSPAGVRRRLRQTYKRIVAAPAERAIPDGDLALLVDGIWSILRGQCWVLYNQTLKPATTNRAWFLDPYLQGGHESVRGWEAAIATIPPALAARIKAVVADGIPGIERLVEGRGWLLQLCHRHLLRSLERKLGHPRRQRAIQQPGRGILAAVEEALDTTDSERATALCDEVLRLGRHPNCTLGLRYTAQYFVRRLQHYRTYLHHPDLALPTTTSAVESMHRRLRQAIGTVNDPDSMQLRVTVYLRLHQTVTCNPGVHQQKL